MYYAEKVIDGVLHFRSSPCALWQIMTPEGMTHRIQILEGMIQKLTNEIDALESSAQEHICGE